MLLQDAADRTVPKVTTALATVEKAAAAILVSPVVVVYNFQVQSCGFLGSRLKKLWPALMSKLDALP